MSFLSSVVLLKVLFTLTDFLVASLGEKVVPNVSTVPLSIKGVSPVEFEGRVLVVSLSLASGSSPLKLVATLP